LTAFAARCPSRTIPAILRGAVAALARVGLLDREAASLVELQVTLAYLKGRDALPSLGQESVFGPVRRGARLAIRTSTLPINCLAPVASRWHLVEEFLQVADADVDDSSTTSERRSSPAAMRRRRVGTLMLSISAAFVSEMKAPGLVLSMVDTGTPSVGVHLAAA
jgi:hypothetical protein